MGRMIDFLNRLQKKPRVMMIKVVRGILDAKKTKSERKMNIEQTRQVMMLILRIRPIKQTRVI